MSAYRPGRFYNHVLGAIGQGTEKCSYPSQFDDENMVQIEAKSRLPKLIEYSYFDLKVRVF